jgi:two-component sensor histidine kinase
LAILSVAITSISALIAHIVHWFQDDPFALHRIGSFSTFLISVIAFIALYKKPSQLRLIMFFYLVLVRVLMVLSSLISIYMVDNSDQFTISENYPPFTAFSFIWVTFVVVYIPFEYLFWVLILGCVPMSVPLLWYLLDHPQELQTGRGIDLFLSYGIATVTYALLGHFYTRLQVNFQNLLQDRITNYTQLIEAQDIRQEAIANLFTQLHNGALQTLAVLSKDLKCQDISLETIESRLELLNQQIRSLVDLEKNSEVDSLSITKLRLAAGVNLNLDLPLHTLAYEVYRATLVRNFPCFSSLKIKVRSFDEIENDRLSLDLKREIGFWLEEALCNVGKHAEGATQLQVRGRIQNGEYCLSVQDNGPGICSDRSGQGTQQSYLLAQKLQGEFKRENLPQGGVNCELRWPI